MPERVFSFGASILPARNRNSSNLQKEYPVMILIRKQSVIMVAIMCALIWISAPAALAQDSNQARPTVQRDEETNLDLQLYLVLATNRDVEDEKLPTSLDPVIKRLKESLTFKHYNLTATFVNRVKNNGTLDVSWVGGPFSIHGSPAQSNPSFSQFTSQVRIVPVDGQDIVRLMGFRFGTRVPVVTGQVAATNATTNTAPFASINYEPVGLRTDLSMREGSMVVAGTLNVGPSGDALVVIISARRAN
jgi:hypothetical protein